MGEYPFYTNLTHDWIITLDGKGWTYVSKKYSPNWRDLTCRFSTSTPQVIAKHEWVAAKPEKKEKGHPHAELMAEYANDALTNPEPWMLWEWRTDRTNSRWMGCTEDMFWVKHYAYRRKPKPTPKMIIGGIEVEASFFLNRRKRKYVI